MLAGCGGGGSSDTAGVDPGAVADRADMPLTVSVAYVTTVKRLDVAQAAQTSLVDEILEAAPALGLQAGDIVIAGETARKLVAALPDTPVGRRRFSTSVPALEEVFTSVELDGRFQGAGELELASIAYRKPSRVASAEKLAIDGCPVSNNVGSLWGIRCELEVDSDAAPVKATGTVALGTEVTLNKWNLITNAGSGTFSIATELAVDLQVKRGTDAAATDSACSSVGLEATSGGRVRIGTLRIPTSVPGIGIAIPFCMSLTGESKVEGTLVRIDDRRRFDIAVGGGQAPRMLNSPATAGSSATRAAPSSASWAITGDPADVASVNALDISGGVTGTLEATVEVTALKIASAGVAARLTGGASVSGKAAGIAIGWGPLALPQVSQMPLACLEAKPTSTASVVAFAAIPSIRSLLGAANREARISLLDVDLLKDSNLGVSVGRCDLKADTQLTLLTDPFSGSFSKTITVDVVRLDTRAGNLWVDRMPTGTVTVSTIPGDAICTIALDANGHGSCPFTFGGSVRTENIIAHYNGDDRYRGSDAGTPAQIDYGNLAYNVTLTDTGTCQDSNYTAQRTGLILQTTVGHHALTLGTRTYEVAVPGTTSGSAIYNEAGGVTREDASFTLSPPNANLTGTVTGSGTYQFTHSSGATCGGSYTVNGTYGAAP